MAPHAGDFLEERAPLFGPQGERLVHHALADEEERIVGQACAVEQVLEIAQAYPRAVQEVLVLARSEESPAQLDDAVVDGEQPVGVLEDHGHLGHAQRGLAFGPGEDDILGAPRAQCSTLLPERPPQGVGQVALARAVRPDHGRNARSELDHGSPGERLEALEPDGQEARGHTHRALAEPRAPTSASRAAWAAAVSARRRLAPSPRHAPIVPTTTSTTKCREWSGPAREMRR